MSDRAFSFLNVSQRQPKPRSRGLTEIRGPYYTTMGKRYLEDISVRTWRTDVPAQIADALGLEQVMFEAADPEVF